MKLLLSITIAFKVSHLISRNILKTVLVLNVIYSGDNMLQTFHSQFIWPTCLALPSRCCISVVVYSFTFRCCFLHNLVFLYIFEPLHLFLNFKCLLNTTLSEIYSIVMKLLIQGSIYRQVMSSIKPFLENRRSSSHAQHLLTDFYFAKFQGQFLCVILHWISMYFNSIRSN